MSTKAQPVLALDAARAERIYRTMFAIRVFEERVEQLFAAGELPGFVHLYIGEEACASGVCATLQDSDAITSTHRGHGHCIAKGGRLDRMMAELFAKRTGYNQGKGGSMHLAASALGIYGANGIVAGGTTLACGAALASKLRGDGAVAVSFFGDGASNQGSVHESMNFAAAFELPVIFACENNQFGVGTRFCSISKTASIADRAAGYGMPGASVDGMDVVAVFDAAAAAVERARAGGGPTLLELRTWRYRAHFQGEPGSYRTKDEEQTWADQDPLAVARKNLGARGLLSADTVATIEHAVKRELEEAVQFGRSSPSPDVADAMADIYA